MQLNQSIGKSGGGGLRPIFGANVSQKQQQTKTLNAKATNLQHRLNLIQNNQQQPIKQTPKAVMPQTSPSTLPLSKQQPSGLSARLAKLQQPSSHTPDMFATSFNINQHPEMEPIAKQQQPIIQTSPSTVHLSKQQPSGLSARLAKLQQPCRNAPEMFSTSLNINQHPEMEPIAKQQQPIKQTSKDVMPQTSPSTVPLPKQQPSGLSARLANLQQPSSHAHEMFATSFNINQHPEMEPIAKQQQQQPIKQTLKAVMPQIPSSTVPLTKQQPSGLSARLANLQQPSRNAPEMYVTLTSRNGTNGTTVRHLLN